MRNNNEILKRKEASLKQLPFRVPEDYFEQFPERLQEHLQKQAPPEVEPVLHSRNVRWRLPMRLAIAAAIIGLALISYSIIRVVAPSRVELQEYLDLALIEEMDILDDDIYLIDLMPPEEEVDEEQAYYNDAMDYLASNDVEFDLLFE